MAQQIWLSHSELCLLARMLTDRVNSGRDDIVTLHFAEKVADRCQAEGEAEKAAAR